MVTNDNPDELDAQAHELEAKASLLRARAARLRAAARTPELAWIPVAALPLPRRAALAAARSGVLRAVKRGRTWLTTRADADAYLRSQQPTPAANDDDVRAALGIARRSA